MYRILLIVLLNVVVGLGCRPPPCHWKQNEESQIINYFEAVARKVINADRKTEEFCNNQGASNIIEDHSLKEYELRIPGAGGIPYEIRVRDRMLQIVSDNCQNSVTDLRILPPYVNAYAGHYYFDNGDLVVGFPYKYDLSAGGGSCEEVNRGVVTLYQGCNNCKTNY